MIWTVRVDVGREATVPRALRSCSRTLCCMVPAAFDRVALPADMSLARTETQDVPGRAFFVSFGGRQFYVGEALGQVLVAANEGQPLGEAIQEYALDHGVPMRDAFVAFHRSFEQIGLVGPGHPVPKSPVKVQITLLAGRSVHRVAAVFQHLLQPRLAVVLAVVSAVIVVGTVYPLFTGSVSQVVSFLVTFPLVLDTTEILQLVVCLLVGIFLHECGHAGAAYRFGVPSLRIGAGFVLCFPVFFCDVTSIWRLTADRRIVVNLGGVYVQLLYASALCGIFAATQERVYLYAIVASVISMVVALSPFMRFDGYWIYADYFDMPSLRTDALRFLSNRLNPFSRVASIAPLPLKVYAYGYCLFVVLATLLTVGFLSLVATYFPFLVDNLSSGSVEQRMRSFFIVALFVVIVARIAVSVFALAVKGRQVVRRISAAYGR